MKMSCKTPVTRSAFPGTLRSVAAMLALAGMQAAMAAPTLTVSAVPSSATTGSSVVVSVLVNGITDLFGFQFSLGFDPAVLQASGVAEGAFLPQGGGTSFVAGTIDNSMGIVSGTADALSGLVPGVSGNGVLATITFSVAGTGTTALSFSNLLFLDSNFVDITVGSQNGSFTGIASNVPEPASYALMGLGVAGLLAAARKRSAA